MPSYDTYNQARLDLGVPFMEYFWKPGLFIADQVLPLLRVGVKKGKFAKIQREHLLRNEDLRRATKAAYSRDDFEAEDDDFTCEEYGVEFPVGDDEQAIYANDFDSGRIAAETAALRLRLAYELRAATAVFNTGTWTGASLYTDISTTWATIASSTPVNDIRAAKEKVADLTGVVPDTLIVNNKNLGYLANASNIIGRIQYAQPAGDEAVRKALANILGVRQILVGSGVYNASKEGTAMSTTTKIWSDSYAMVCKLPETESLADPGIGRTFLFAPDSQEVTMESYREEQTRSTVYRARHYVDEVIIDSAFGHLLKVD